MSVFRTFRDATHRMKLAIRWSKMRSNLDPVRCSSLYEIDDSGTHGSSSLVHKKHIPYAVFHSLSGSFWARFAEALRNSHIGPLLLGGTLAGTQKWSNLIIFTIGIQKEKSDLQNLIFAVLQLGCPRCLYSGFSLMHITVRNLRFADSKCFENCNIVWTSLMNITVRNWRFAHSKCFENWVLFDAVHRTKLVIREPFFLCSTVH